MGTGLSDSLSERRALRFIWKYRGVSRTEIARVLGLDKSTVTDIVGKLLNKGLVTEETPRSPRGQGGRPPKRLSIRDDYGAVIGVDLQPHSVTLVATNLVGRELFSYSEACDIDRNSLVPTLENMIGEASSELYANSLRVLGTGIGITGIIDTDRGQVTVSIPLRIEKPLSIADEIQRRTDTATVIDNDANCCAWGELAFRGERDLRNFIFIVVELASERQPGGRSAGVGLGLSFVIEGKVYRGTDFSTGEFRSLFRKPGNGSQFSLSDDETFRITQDKDIRERFMRELASHVALFANSMNLKTIFFGGAIEQFADEFIPIMEEELHRNWAYETYFRREYTISPSTHGNKAVAVGAAGMMLERFFGIPDLSNDVREEEPVTASEHR